MNGKTEVWWLGWGWDLVAASVEVGYQVGN